MVHIDKTTKIKESADFTFSFMLAPPTFSNPDNNNRNSLRNMLCFN